MCITITRTFVTKRPMIAYKWVHKIPGGYRSAYPTDTRDPQQPGGGVGIHKRYKIGAVARSPMPRTPGLYLYSRKNAALRYGGGSALLRVEIPAGATVAQGAFNKLCASEIKVLGEVKL